MILFGNTQSGSTWYYLMSVSSEIVFLSAFNLICKIPNTKRHCVKSMVLTFIENNPTVRSEKVSLLQMAAPLPL